MPSLLNLGSDYHLNYVLRDQPPKLNTVAGAIDIQNMFDDLEWLQASGDVLSYAPHLSLSPLPNVPAKATLFQFAFGDQSVPNPEASAWIRAAGMFESSILHRADLAATMAASLGQSLPSIHTHFWPIPPTGPLW